MIDAYSFGRISVQGKAYQNDLIILPDGEIVSSWWRKSGHQLVLEDLEPVLQTRARVLVVGTGDPGLMKPHPSLAAALEERGIEMVVLPTAEAVKEFNLLRKKSAETAGCFHLTC